MLKQFHLTHFMGSLQVLPQKVRVDLGLIAINWYSTFPSALWLEPHYQMQFSVILWTLFKQENTKNLVPFLLSIWGGLPRQSSYSKPWWLVPCNEYFPPGRKISQNKSSSFHVTSHLQAKQLILHSKMKKTTKQNKTKTKTETVEYPTKKLISEILARYDE